MGALFTQVAADTLNNSKGVVATAAYIGELNVNSVMLLWRKSVLIGRMHNKRVITMGISQEEADRSGLMNIVHIKA